MASIRVLYKIKLLHFNVEPTLFPPFARHLIDIQRNTSHFQDFLHQYPIVEQTALCSQWQCQIKRN